VISDTIELAKERIRSIDWKWNETKYSSIAGSSYFLLQEFLRRAALWAEAFGLIDVPGTGWPMIDYASYVDPSLKIDDSGDSDEVLPEAEKLQVDHLSWYERRVCVYFVHWAAVKDRSEVTKYSLPDPYEPLIVLYERGGSFRKDHSGVWEYHNTSGFPACSANYYLSSEPIVELDKVSLDKADEDFERSREEVIAQQGA
jgi:hypothetical protein